MVLYWTDTTVSSFHHTHYMSCLSLMQLPEQRNALCCFSQASGTRSFKANRVVVGGGVTLAAEGCRAETAWAVIYYKGNVVGFSHLLLTWMDLHCLPEYFNCSRLCYSCLVWPFLCLPHPSHRACFLSPPYISFCPYHRERYRIRPEQQECFWIVCSRDTADVLWTIRLLLCCEAVNSGNFLGVYQCQQESFHQT